MKAYKIDLSMYPGKVREVVSEAVQKKAFELGYKWGLVDATTKLLDSGYLYLWGNGDIGRTGDSPRDTEYYIGSDYQPITADDFLNLESAKPEFKPFDKVLVRDDDDDKWEANFYTRFGDKGYPYISLLSAYKQCIPYEGNEHLLGTTNKE